MYSTVCSLNKSTDLMLPKIVCVYVCVCVCVCLCVVLLYYGYVCMYVLLTCVCGFHAQLCVEVKMFKVCIFQKYVQNSVLEVSVYAAQISVCNTICLPVLYSRVYLF